MSECSDQLAVLALLADGAAAGAEAAGAALDDEVEDADPEEALTELVEEDRLSVR